MDSYGEDIPKGIEKFVDKAKSQATSQKLVHII